LTGACGSDPDRGGPPALVGDACATIEADVEGSFDALARLVAIETHRAADFSNEEQIAVNLQTVYGELQAQIQAFNEGQTTHKLELSDWQQETGASGEPKYWRVFKVRIGTGPYKIALSTHLDTVSPGDASVWEPFTLKREMRDHGEAGPQEFWVGRGSIDDKGPAISILQVLKSIARAYDGSPLLDNITVELIFDTSEETSMSMPHYLEQNPEEYPDAAVIFDAFWCVRAEKGIERPVFTITRDAPATQGVWIDSVNTPPGPTNQIPDRAEAIIRSDSQPALEQLAGEISAMYDAHPFDDPAYRRATLTVDTSGMPGELKLIAEVAGAQHGSAPHENRADGANPLVSLTNFLGALVETSALVDNDVGRMCRFVKWMWGTKVFGENHPELLERDDEVFTSGNGTTYAVTRLTTDGAAITLKVDIRYAIGHHSQPWDGETEGFLCGSESVFADSFTTLVDEFNAGSAGPLVTFETVTRAAPDIRRPDGPTFSKVSSAYQEVMGEPCPALAIGGGTDAKGQVKFLAAGALFGDHLGPPINFHGINEGAPVRELAQGAKILCRLIDQEIQHAAEGPPPDDEPPPRMCEGVSSKSSASPAWMTGHQWR
jgi:succinyl-diaminopimelate desuccinylase